MLLPIFLLLMIAVILVQLRFCFYSRKLWIKLLPTCLFVGGAVICWVVYLLASVADFYGVEFVSYICAIIMLYFAASTVFCWGIYGIVKLIQKFRK